MGLRQFPRPLTFAAAGEGGLQALHRALTVEDGLSLGDRYSLALAKRQGLPALTTERGWSMIAADAGVAIEMIH